MTAAEWLGLDESASILMDAVANLRRWDAIECAGPGICPNIESHERSRSIIVATVTAAADNYERSSQYKRPA